MDFGAHLPQIQFEGTSFTLEAYVRFAERAEALGYAALTVNDHLVFSRPWLDGPTALAAVLAKTSNIQMGTTLALPVVRGPVALAKTLAAIDLLSGGRLFVGIGPGSSVRDYAAVGVPFEERWKRLDDCIHVLRGLWQREAEPFVGAYYSTGDLHLEPYPVQQGGPPIWVGSWGSDAGLKRVARLADGWLASAYNTTPSLFKEGLDKLMGWLVERGRDAQRFPNAIATMWTYVTEDRNEAELVLRDVVAAMLNLPAEDLRERVLIGPAEECAAKLAAYREAGAQRVFIWPVKDPLTQLSVFMERVTPLVDSR